ncbi:MAG TPA: hypothetical protein VM802_27405 [Chitinophaga sp.]|uniref:terpene synthase family protein n=1 Tax=Chitinophaga sp. TaxID=1869181 RepID=UPI002D092D91|nr:hypothetical protein [Chitinophaga sp.]HVI48626.1 hypothetical protein [Chitinophaga sp.]
MKMYAIPQVFCPFETGGLRYLYQVRCHTTQWLKTFRLTSSKEQLDYYLDQKFAEMIVLSYPFGRAEDLCIWCDLNSLLFIVDDQLDEQGVIRGKRALLAFFRRFIRVLENHETCTLEHDGPVFTALSDYWKRICMRSGSAWQQQFIKGVRQMFAGGLWQFEHLENNTSPSLDEYLEHRQFLGAANLATDSIEIMAGVSLPAFVHQHPVMEQLVKLCRDAICFSNDLYSYSKEAAYSQGGAAFNLVTVLSDAYDLSVENAIRKCVAIHDECVKEFIRLSGSIYVFNTTINYKLRRYVKALEALMKGNIEWSTRYTTRYPHLTCDYVD